MANYTQEYSPVSNRRSTGKYSLPTNILMTGNIKELSAYQETNNDSQARAYIGARIEANSYIQKLSETKERNKDPNGPELKDSNGMKYLALNKPSRNQTSDNGCWSASLEVLLGSRGVKIPQEIIRGFRPRTEPIGENASFDPKLVEAFNDDTPQDLYTRAELIMRTLPNTGLHQRQYATYSDAMERENKNAPYVDEEKLGKQLSDDLYAAIAEKKSPVSIMFGGHFRTVVGIDRSNGELMYLDSLSKDTGTPQICKIQDVIDRTRGAGDGRIMTYWLEDLEPKNGNLTLADGAEYQNGRLVEGAGQNVKKDESTFTATDTNNSYLDTENTACLGNSNTSISGVSISDHLFLPKQLTTKPEEYKETQPPRNIITNIPRSYSGSDPAIRFPGRKRAVKAPRQEPEVFFDDQVAGEQAMEMFEAVQSGKNDPELQKQIEALLKLEREHKQKQAEANKPEADSNIVEESIEPTVIETDEKKPIPTSPEVTLPETVPVDIMEEKEEPKQEKPPAEEPSQEEDSYSDGEQSNMIDISADGGMNAPMSDPLVDELRVPADANLPNEGKQLPVNEISSIDRPEDISNMMNLSEDGKIDLEEIQTNDKTSPEKSLAGAGSDDLKEEPQPEQKKLQNRSNISQMPPQSRPTLEDLPDFDEADVPEPGNHSMQDIIPEKFAFEDGQEIPPIRSSEEKEVFSEKDDGVFLKALSDSEQPKNPVTPTNETPETPTAAPEDKETPGTEETKPAEKNVVPQPQTVQQVAQEPILRESEKSSADTPDSAEKKALKKEIKQSLNSKAGSWKKEGQPRHDIEAIEAIAVLAQSIDENSSDVSRKTLHGDQADKAWAVLYMYANPEKTIGEFLDSDNKSTAKWYLDERTNIYDYQGSRDKPLEGVLEKESWLKDLDLSDLYRLSQMKDLQEIPTFIVQSRLERQNGCKVSYEDIKNIDVDTLRPAGKQALKRNIREALDLKALDILPKDPCDDEARTALNELSLHFDESIGDISRKALHDDQADLALATLFLYANQEKKLSEFLPDFQTSEATGKSYLDDRKNVYDYQGSRDQPLRDLLARESWLKELEPNDILKIGEAKDLKELSAFFAEKKKESEERNRDPELEEKQRREREKLRQEWAAEDERERKEREEEEERERAADDAVARPSLLDYIKDIFSYIFTGKRSPAVEKWNSYVEDRQKKQTAGENARERKAERKRKERKEAAQKLIETQKKERESKRQAQDSVGEIAQKKPDIGSYQTGVTKEENPSAQIESQLTANQLKELETGKSAGNLEREKTDNDPEKAGEKKKEQKDAEIISPEEEREQIFDELKKAYHTSEVPEAVKKNILKLQEDAVQARNAIQKKLESPDQFGEINVGDNLPKLVVYESLKNTILNHGQNSKYLLERLKDGNTGFAEQFQASVYADEKINHFATGAHDVKQYEKFLTDEGMKELTVGFEKCVQKSVETEEKQENHALQQSEGLKKEEKRPEKTAENSLKKVINQRADTTMVKPETKISDKLLEKPEELLSEERMNRAYSF